jgi:hypothetical protein
LAWILLVTAYVHLTMLDSISRKFFTKNQQKNSNIVVLD